jgi:thiosulfate/3-mercaptopyruvate sulfurtransferase
VVVYDDMGGAFAVRLWWLLRWIGHDCVALLDRGLEAWIAAGGELVQDETR